MVKIKISYEDMSELIPIVQAIKPLIRTFKVSSEKKGKYYRAYIDCNTDKDSE